MKELNKWVEELLRINPNRTVDELHNAMHKAYSKDKIERVLKLLKMDEEKPINLEVVGGTVELDVEPEEN